jgi:ribosomal protein L11 methyltransferase
MDWRQFAMDLETLNPDAVEEIFARHGATSITLTDAGDRPVLEPAPGKTPLWRDTRMTGLFSPDADLGALRTDLLESLSIAELPAHEVAVLADRAWEREWRKDFGPMQFGSRLWICPGDSSVDHQDAVVVKLDPGLAFGTGTHASTALCLEWLDGLNLQGSTVLDIGCGSGVLVIAALLLGSERAVALDIDPQAIRATVENALSNDVRDRLMVTNHMNGIAGGFDVVIANILAAPLIDMAELIAGHVNGGCVLALSGILSEQVDQVLEAYRPWIEFDEPVTREQDTQTWARLTGRRIKG